MFKFMITLFSIALLALPASATPTTNQEACLRMEGTILMQGSEVSLPLLYGFQAQPPAQHNNSATLNTWASAMARFHQEGCHSTSIVENIYNMLLLGEALHKAQDSYRLTLNTDMSPQEVLCHVASYELTRLEREAPARYTSKMDETSLSYSLAIHARESLMDLGDCAPIIAASFTGE